LKKQPLFLAFLIVAVLTLVCGTSPPAVADSAPAGTSWSQDWDTSVVPSGDTIYDITANTTGGLDFSGPATGITVPGWTSSLVDPAEITLAGPGTSGTFDFTLNFASLLGATGTITLDYDIGSATYWETYSESNGIWTFLSSGDPPKAAEPGTLALFAFGLASLVFFRNRFSFLRQKQSPH
jgi:hypothetical protein